MTTTARTVEANRSEKLFFKFAKPISSGYYTVTLRFDNGCQVSTSRVLEQGN